MRTLLILLAALAPTLAQGQPPPGGWYNAEDTLARARVGRYAPPPAPAPAATFDRLECWPDYSRPLLGVIICEPAIRKP